MRRKVSKSLGQLESSVDNRPARGRVQATISAMVPTEGVLNDAKQWRFAWHDEATAGQKSLPMGE
jgi:hypothetical protein